MEWCGAIAPCHFSTIKANIAHMFYWSMFTSKNIIMTTYIEFVDVSSGEIIYHKQMSYAFSFVPNDVGFGKLLDVLRSACRGARIKHSPYQVRIMFHEDVNTQQTLPFSDVNQFETPYEVKPF